MTITVPNGGPGHSGLTEAFAKQTSPLHRLSGLAGVPHTAESNLQGWEGWLLPFL